MTAPAPWSKRTPPPTLKHYSLHFFVPGTPAPQGSKRHIGGGRMIESSQNLGPWRERIALVAHNTMIEAGIPITDNAITLTMKFVLPRPKATPKTRATPAAIKKPDLDKLARAVLDSLTHVVYYDDAQVTSFGDTRKRLAELNETPGVHITVES